MQFGHAKHNALASVESPSKLDNTRPIDTAERNIATMLVERLSS